MSEHSCRTEVETPHNSPTPHLLDPQPPAGTRSLSLAPHPRGMSRPPAMPRPPTSRRPHSVVRPTSTSRPSLVPYPPSVQRVRAERSPSIEPMTRAMSRQSRTARRTVLPTGTNKPHGARHGESIQSGQHARVCKKITKEKGCTCLIRLDLLESE